MIWSVQQFFYSGLVVCLFSIFGTKIPTDKALEIVMRSIGNKVLWSQGDSVSRVLPIDISENKEIYTISFEKSIDITSDSLYDIVTKELAKVDVHAFIAELKQCQTNEVVLAIIHYQPNDSIQPCGGRQTPSGCYQIVITLTNKKVGIYTILPPLFVVLFGLVFFYVKKNKSKNSGSDVIDTADDSDLIQLGIYSFYVNDLKLKKGEETIILTDKEAKLLSLFVHAINQNLTREKLMAEIWGESGVMVISRNIDVLVSKLRKKLIEDERIKITNVHGVGYKMEIGT